MPRFGKNFPLTQGLNFFGRLGYLIHGYHFIGGFQRSIYFRKAIKGLSFERILDAGCGAGEYSFFLAEKFPFAKIDAMDKNKTAIELNKALQKKLKLLNITFFQGDLTKLSKRNEYDFAFSVDVLEHLKENEKAVRLLFKSLKKGGFLFLHMPSGKHTEKMLKERKLKRYAEFVKEEHIGKGFELDEMVSFLESLGLKVLSSGNSFGFFGGKAWLVEQVLHEKSLGYLKAIALPFLKLLCHLDALMKNREGFAFYVLAQK